MKELDPYESRINDHERENQGETRKRYSVNWKEKRKREVHRQIFLLVSVLLILIIGAVLLRLLLTNSGAHHLNQTIIPLRRKKMMKL